MSSAVYDDREVMPRRVGARRQEAAALPVVPGRIMEDAPPPMIPHDNPLSSLRPDTVARKVLQVSTAVTLALYMIPYGRFLARPLLLLSTLAHELGHGLTALVLGGS